MRSDPRIVGHDKPIPVETLHEVERQAETSIPESRREIPVGSFMYQGRTVIVDPPLDFICEFHEKEGLYTIKGKPPYEDILAYGHSPKEALDVLRGEMIAVLWDDCTIDRKHKLSDKAATIRGDLKKRV